MTTMTKEIIAEIKEGLTFYNTEIFVECTKAIRYLENELHLYKVHSLELGTITEGEFSEIKTEVNKLISELEERQTNIWKAVKGGK